ncbi:BREX-1 system phosphatase PglZ type A [Donghicola tyrosinivorans]|uniref:Uncharacterized protein (TIGR02687 family) n=1 Tax=Donghicola tyrosinivorans TaxID=1652492 RepID=A0A2T0X5Z3_9RHOB|nr:BREX-1 system phosphatase PglZ type A [Donghicola tyrosinivorans]PRY94294.1 uncharacterized protein (TIGR02687 family) [Donghicola tyrosinivorans]
MSERIHAGLTRLFDEHRIVFWYDAARDMRGEFDAVDLEGVEKVEVANNEFGLKYRMLRQEPKQKFLVFKDGPEPAMADNWLLDVQLATAVFKADQAAIWLSELGLPAQFETVVRDHMEFYRSGGRIEALKRLIRPADQKSDVLRRMLAVCVGAEGELDTVVEELLGQLAARRDDGLKLIERANLSDFFWTQIKNAYGYAPDAPDFEDFAITLFQSSYLIAMGEDGKLNSEALLMFRRWKNNRLGAVAFGALSSEYQDLLKIDADVKGRTLKALRPLDHFEAIDRQVIRMLVEAMSSQTVSAADVVTITRERRQSHWYETYEDIYLALAHAAQFQQALAEANLTMSSPADGVKRYATSWFKIDQAYRKFIYHMQRSGQASLLGALFESIENRYTTNFLLAVNDAWQDQIAKLDAWKIPGYPQQRDFYIDQTAEFRRLKSPQKVVVIVSDALRYEVAEECLREIRKLNRFDAELTPMISTLPSYTQLGMAALLPNKDLTICSDGGVTSFDMSTQGTVNREKVLGMGREGDRMKAMKTDAFMSLRTDEGKALFRDHDVLYLYHNRIDIVGDKLATEERVVEAAEDAIKDLAKLVRKLTSANFSNILITADHGFIYQHRELHETDFSVADPTGDEILFRNRRFMIGRGLNETAGMKRFSPEALGLAGDLDILIPNSINRLRVKGSGSRFVHGGATLQEVVIPILRVGKRREEDIGKVEVQIVVTGRSKISTGQTAVTLYQVQPVSEKQQQRVLRAGIYAEDGTLISDEHTLTFDYTSENIREREMPIKFLLSRTADSFNNQDVYLRLAEQRGKTSHFDDYTSHRFHLSRGMDLDIF